VTGRVCGKTILITGAAQGIGAATAALLAREGARVVLTDINGEGAEDAADEINGLYGPEAASAIRHDVIDELDWARAIEHARSFMGGLSVLINNAGIVTTGSVEDLSLAEWRRNMAVNTDSVFLGIKAALPLLRQSTPASIVNLSSIAGLIASHNLASYNASKAAVWLLSKSVALHCARNGWDIRCNSVRPAFIQTPILKDLIKDQDEAVMVAKLARQVPLGRLGTADEVAQAILYLASDESRFMTGAEMKLDGGISAM